MVMVPFLNVIVALVVALALNFFLWITQLEKTVNDFQQIFIVAVISTMITWLWLLGDLFSAVMNKSAAN
jgi:fructose-specific phosphotransferase system IIC component